MAIRTTKTKRICARHRCLYPGGDQCPQCKVDKREREKPMRQRAKERLGRSSPHWRELSFRMIRRHRNTLGSWCPSCLRLEDKSDPSSKLTLDLVRGGDHRTATEAECEVKCRRCHGRQQGARRGGGVTS